MLEAIKTLLATLLVATAILPITSTAQSIKAASNDTVIHRIPMGAPTGYRTDTLFERGIVRHHSYYSKRDPMRRVREWEFDDIGRFTPLDLYHIEHRTLQAPLIPKQHDQYYPDGSYQTNNGLDIG